MQPVIKNIKNNLFSLFFILFLSCTFNIVQAQTTIVEMPMKQNVSINKVWKVRFNRGLNLSTINSTNVTVKDPTGKVIDVKVNISRDNNIVKITPPVEGYAFGTTYVLQINNTMKSDLGSGLKNLVTMKFSTEAEPSLPELNLITMEHEPFLMGETGEVFVTSRKENKVQYRAFLYSKQTKTYTELTQGYSQVQEGNIPFRVSLPSSLQAGDYELKVYAKRANIAGKYQDSNTKFDTSDMIEIQRFPKEGVVAALEGKLLEVLQIRNKIGQPIILQGSSAIQALEPAYTINTKVQIYDLQKIELPTYIGGIKETISWDAPKAGHYLVEAQLEAIDKVSGKRYEVKQRFPIEVYNQQYNYEKYSKGIEEIVNMQSKNSPVYYTSKGFLPAGKEDVYEYVNPNLFLQDEYGKFQFLRLNYIEGITAEELNIFLKGKGVLEGKGEAFLKAGKQWDISPIYLVSHARLETGNGTSALAKGILVSKVKGVPVTPKVAYNMFGIGAYDSDPNGLGSQYAYQQGWFSVEDAIIGGAKWIGERYINNAEYKQNTLYKMRWNPALPTVHQYATDVAWAYKQIKSIKDLLDQCPKAFLIFDIPQFIQ